MATEQTTIQLPSRYEQLRSTAEEIRQTPKAFVGLTLLTAITVISVLGPYFVPYDPTAIHSGHILEGPSAQFLLGTDALGRDLLSRVIIGGRTSLLLGFGSVGLALGLGIPIGLTAGYTHGKVDEVIMRAMDLLMSIPTLLLGLLILTALSSNVWNAIFAVGIVYAPRIARVVRSATLEESNSEYVQSAKAQGESTPYILFGEILPNITAPILVEGSIRIGFAILIGSSLSFLGLGAQPPNPDWGYMINTARGHIFESAWFLLWPSIALTLTVFSVNMLGDGLRDVFDTKYGGDEL
ncbi:ABC transporter permease [Haloarculaceae archaeon H-GB11]|nr:ABC transporter permease [Haloarculaceae archaeon H-GB11]